MEPLTLTTEEERAERWLPVITGRCFDRYYLVSDMGRVKRSSSGRILVGGVGTSRYVGIAMCAEGQQRTLSVHELVCRAFHGPRPSPEHEVRHVSGNRGDNRASNLKWATHAENMADMRWDRHATSQYGEKNTKAKLTDEKIAEIRRLYATAGYTQTALGEMFGVRQTQISHIVRGIQWQHLADAPAPSVTRHHLTIEDVRAIRLALADGLATAEIARRFNTTTNAVGFIRTGRTWKGVL